MVGIPKSEGGAEFGVPGNRQTLLIDVCDVLRDREIADEEETETLDKKQPRAPLRGFALVSRNILL